MVETSEDFNNSMKITNSGLRPGDYLPRGEKIRRTARGRKERDRLWVFHRVFKEEVPSLKEKTGTLPNAYLSERKKFVRKLEGREKG